MNSLNHWAINTSPSIKILKAVKQHGLADNGICHKPDNVSSFPGMYGVEGKTDSASCPYLYPVCAYMDIYKN